MSQLEFNAILGPMLGFLTTTALLLLVAFVAPKTAERAEKNAQ